MISLELTGDEQKAVQAILKLSQAQEQLGKRTEETGKKAKKAGEDSETGMKQTAMMVRNLIGDYGKLAGVIAVYTRAMEDARNAEKTAADRMRSAESGFGAILRASRGDERAVKLMLGQARELYGQGGAANLGEAAGKIATLTRAGAADWQSIDLVARLTGITESPEGMVASAAKIGRIAPAAGDVAQIISKAMAVSGKPEDLLAATAKVFPKVAIRGYSPDEVLGAMAVIARQTGAEVAGPSLAALTRSLAEAPGMRGRSLSGQVERMRGMVSRGGDLDKLLGPKAIAAYTVLSQDPEALVKMTAKISAPDAAAALPRMLSAAAGIPELEAIRRGRQASAIEATSTEDLAFGEMEWQRRIAVLKAAQRRRGVSEANISISEAVIDKGIDLPLFGHVGGLRSWAPTSLSEWGLREMEREVGLKPGSALDALLNRVGNQLERAAGKLEKIGDGAARARTVGKPEDDR